MTKREKRFQKVLDNPKETSFGKVHTILNDFGYKLFRVNGSHHIYKKRNSQPLNISVHNKEVKKIYIKNIIKHLHEST